MLRSNWGQPLLLRCDRANLPWSKQRNAKIFLSFGNLKWIMGCPYSRSGLKWFSLIFQYFIKILSWFSVNCNTKKTSHSGKSNSCYQTIRNFENLFYTLILQPMLHELCTIVAWPILNEQNLYCITSEIPKFIKMWKSLICMDL